MLLAPAVGLLGACSGGGGSKYTLHTVMLQMDHDDKALMQTLGDPARATPSLESLQRWGSDPAFEAYVGSVLFEGDPADFRSQHDGFKKKLEAALQAARDGDAGALQSRYFQMRMSCETCHAKYRPEVR